MGTIGYRLSRIVHRASGISHRSSEGNHLTLVHISFMPHWRSIIDRPCRLSRPNRPRETDLVKGSTPRLTARCLRRRVKLLLIDPRAPLWWVAVHGIVGSCWIRILLGRGCSTGGLRGDDGTTRSLRVHVGAFLVHPCKRVRGLSGSARRVRSCGPVTRRFHGWLKVSTRVGHLRSLDDSPRRRRTIARGFLRRGPSVLTGCLHRVQVTLLLIDPGTSLWRVAVHRVVAHHLHTSNMCRMRGGRRQYCRSSRRDQQGDSRLRQQKGHVGESGYRD